MGACSSVRKQKQCVVGAVAPRYQACFRSEKNVAGATFNLELRFKRNEDLSIFDPIPGSRPLHR
jgi:hypothetical protein